MDDRRSVRMSPTCQGFVQGHEENQDFEGKHYSPCNPWGQGEIPKLEKGAYGSIPFDLANKMLDWITIQPRTRAEAYDC